MDKTSEAADEAHANKVLLRVLCSTKSSLDARAADLEVLRISPSSVLERFYECRPEGWLEI